MTTTNAPSTSQPAASSSRASVALVAAMIACALGLAAVLSTNDPFLSNDGPSHVSSKFIHDHLDDPALGFSAFYARNQPWSARGFDELFSALDHITHTWRFSYDATVILLAELWAFGFVAVVAALDRRRAALGLLGFGFALQVILYLGLYTFLAGTAVGMFAIALSLRARDDVHVGLARALGLALLLALTAHCHVVALGITGIVLGAIAIARASSARSLATNLAALLIASSPALLIAFLSRGAVAEHAGAFDFDWKSALDRTLFIERSFQPSGVVRPLAALGFVVAGAVSFARASRAKGDFDRVRREEAALFVVGVVFVLLSMIVPRDLASWQLANTRFLPMGTVALASLIAIERWKSRARVFAVALVAAYVLGSFAWALSFHRELRDATKNAVAALDRVKPEPRDWLPVIVKPYGDHDDDWGIDGFVPLLHVADLYVMNLGGAVEYGQTDLPSIHTVLRTKKRDGETPPKELWLEVLHAPANERADRLRILLASAITRDGIIFYGEPADRAILDDVGYVSTLSDDGLYIGHFEGCDATVTLVANAETQVSVEAGLWPRKTPTDVLAAHLGPHEDASTMLQKFACGDVWLRVPGHACNKAPKDAPIRAHFTRGAANTLRCTLDDAATDDERRDAPR